MSNTADFNIIKQALYSTKLSRMLAEENIGVEFSSTASTASFSPEHRVLTFPHSTAFLDTDVHELFMFHEISHALHLPVDAIKRVKDSGADHDMFNIVIDIRDERLIKLRYPGSVKTFNEGYKKLIDQKFFGDSNAMTFRKFADRLNIYAKCGPVTASFIKMSKLEHGFYEDCMKAETLEECIELAKRLETLDKDSADIRGYRDFLNQMLVDSDSDEEESQEEIDRLINEMKDERVQSIFDGSFQNSILSNANVINYTSFPWNKVNLVSTKKFTDYVKEHNSKKWNTPDASAITQNVREMRKSISQTVDSMVRVFESRKAAERYKNAKIADTGMIDINKVHRYKFDDKIFRKVMSVPNSKNHAYYLLVDCSGSMHKIMQSVIEQIVVMTEFFRRIQVPYKVVGFGATRLHVIDANWDKNHFEYGQSPAPSIIRNCTGEALIEFMNSDQSLLDHNMSITGLLNHTGWDLGGTPTAYGIMASEQYANDFFTRVGATSKHMVVITDGEPTDLVTTGYGRYGKTIVMVDPVTKKSVVSRSISPYATISCIGKLLENRYGWHFTTISLMGVLAERATSAFVSSVITETMKSEWRVSGYTKLLDPYTKTEVLCAKPFGVDTDIGNIGEDVAEKSSSQIARSMLKNMKKIKKSRNFLNALAERLS